MCSHFDPVLDPAKLDTYFGVEPQLPLDLKDSLWPGYIGPLIREHEFADVDYEAVPHNELLIGSFGLIPHWAKDTKIALSMPVQKQPIPSQAFVMLGKKTGKASFQLKRFMDRAGALTRPYPLESFALMVNPWGLPSYGLCGRIRKVIKSCIALRA